jgi:hypothetical protein
MHQMPCRESTDHENVEGKDREDHREANADHDENDFPRSDAGGFLLLEFDPDHIPNLI